MNGTERPVARHRALGRTLQITSLLSLCGVVMATCIMFNQFTSTDRTSYTLAWLNAILGGYAWMGFWLGGLLKSTRRWKQVVCIVLLLIGGAVLILSLASEIEYKLR